MGRFGLIEWISAAIGVALLALGGRQLAADYRYKAGARDLDVEVTEVLLAPGGQSWLYVVRANDQGRELKLTLPGVERARNRTPRPAASVGERLRVLYNPESWPAARWDGHVWDGSIYFLVFGGGLTLAAIGLSFFNGPAPARRRKAR